MNSMKLSPIVVLLVCLLSACATESLPEGFEQPIIKLVRGAGVDSGKLSYSAPIQEQGEAQPVVLPAPLAASVGGSPHENDILDEIRNQRRVALVIGNGAYQHAEQLRNPENDANAIAQVLRKRGFEVVKAVNQSRSQLEQTIRAFSHEADGADAALYYYSGHAIQIGDKNWMLPVDADIRKKSDIPLQSNSMSLVIDQMTARAKTNIVMLDACRNNPFESRMVSSHRGSSANRGLARIQPTDSNEVYIAFATAPGVVALDGRGNYSPFSEAILENLQVDGPIELTDLMQNVRRSVRNETRDEEVQQVPWGSSSLTERFYF